MDMHERCTQFEGERLIPIFRENMQILIFPGRAAAEAHPKKSIFFKFDPLIF